MAMEAVTARVKDGTIVIPQEVLERYHLREGDEVEIVPEATCVRLRKPSRRDLSRFVGILKDTALAKTTDEYMREIRPR